MTPARYYLETDPVILRQRILDYPLALITAVSEGRALVVHAPVHPFGEGEALRLHFHLSIANAVTKALLAGSPALAVFTGPHAYVSPDWYGIDDQVPTWNYVSVEAEGPAMPLERDATLRLLNEISDHFEGQLAPKPIWKIAKMTPARLEGMLRGIVAFELQPTRFEGVTKLNQNKPAAARAGVIKNLEAIEGSTAIAAEMRRIKP